MNAVASRVRGQPEPRLAELPASEHQASLPGMPTAEELDQLSSLRGPEFDALLLDLMTRHHDAGIALAEEAMANADDPRLRLLADQMRHTQTAQNEQMREWMR